MMKFVLRLQDTPLAFAYSSKVEIEILQDGRKLWVPMFQMSFYSQILKFTAHRIDQCHKTG